MKKSLLLFFGITAFVSASLIAQPILTATGINLVVGDIIPVVNCSNGVSAGSGGANQIWDLSALTGTLETDTMVSVASTPNASDFPNANVAWKAQYGNQYYKTSSFAWQNFGYAYGSSIMTFSDPMDLLHFPFAYNNTYTDNFAGIMPGTPTTYEKGSVTVTADGYGTVTTSAGTYNNAMRIHWVENYQDSTNNGSPSVTTYFFDEYLWFVNGTHYLVASVYNYTIGGSVTATGSGGSYLNNFAMQITDQTNLLANCDFFPNPAIDNINLKYSLSENQKVEIRLFNMLGSQVNSTVSAEGMVGANDFKLDVSALPEGVYFAQIHLDGALSTTRRFVVSK